MRVLLVTSQLPHQGKSLDMAPLVRQVRSLEQAGARVAVLQVSGWKRIKYLQAVPRLHRRALEADIIHAHYAFCGWLARTCLWKPVVCSFMGDDVLGTPDTRGRPSWPSRLIVQASRQLARQLDAVIVKSQEMADVLAPVKSHVVPNGVDVDAFRPMDRAAAREQLGWDKAARYILFPGNPANPRKGFDLAQATVAAARRITCEPLQIVVLRGVPPEQVPLYMNACDVMLMTSWLEGSPNVIKEAMACNLPVVSVPVGDVPHLFANVGGCSLQPRDPQALAEALLGLLTTPEGYSEGRAALLRQQLDLDSVAHRILEIYEELLSARNKESVTVTAGSR